MKLLRRMNLRFMINRNGIALVMAFFVAMGMLRAQETDESMAINDTTSTSNKVKLDGIAAVCWHDD